MAMMYKLYSQEKTKRKDIKESLFQRTQNQVNLSFHS